MITVSHGMRDVVWRLLRAGCVVLWLARVGESAPAPAVDGPIHGTAGVATVRAQVNFANLPQVLTVAGAETNAEWTGGDVVPFGALPEALPIPAWATPPITTAASAPEPEPEPSPLAASPGPAASFLGLGDSGTSIPPDTHGTVGPNHLMVTLNTQVRVQTRTGTVLSTVTLDSYWQALGSPDAFDPKILYDSFSNRWIFVACADSRSSSSAVLIGVSQTSDPTGSWNLYRVDADAANLVWVDYPSIGFNKNWIVVQMNMFNVSNNAFNRTHLYVFNKSDLYAGGAGAFTLISDNSIGGTQVPAITHDNTVNTMYVLQDWNGNFSGSGYLRLYTITGAIGFEVLTEISFPSTANPWDSAPPDGLDFVPQLGASQKIQANDSRMQRVVYRNGSLWGVHTVFLPAGGSPTRASVQWWELTPAGGVLQRSRIDDAGGITNHFFPSLDVNQNADVLIGYSRGSANQFVSANYSFRYGTDAANTLRDDTVLKAGEAKYYKTFSGTRNRWGDYSATCVDPVNDYDMWTLQEYASTPSGGSDRWGTWWGKVSPLQGTFDLQVSSPYGTATPPVGSNNFAVATAVTAMMLTSPITVAGTQETLTAVCTGWVGSGSVPASGVGTNTGAFTLLEDSSVTWQWSVTDRILSNRTESGVATFEATSTIRARDGFRVAPTGEVTLRAGDEIRLQPGFQVDTGGVFRAVIDPLP
ncbi:MAG: hypothetical protein O3B24_03955 [Verrucomicrobia bacterium]|nr:hypothetical protein [Verrucomicrobiota bacterium]